MELICFILLVLLGLSFFSVVESEKTTRIKTKTIPIDRGGPVIKGFVRNDSQVESVVTFRMKVVYHQSALAVLVAVVCGQYCVEETLDCSKDVPLILKLGNDSCACDREEHAGAFKYANNTLHVCLGNRWSAIRSKRLYSYGTKNNPGFSCKDIRDKSAEKQLSDGVYWLHNEGKIGKTVFCNQFAHVMIIFFVVNLNVLYLISLRFK